MTLKQKCMRSQRVFLYMEPSTFVGGTPSCRYFAYRDEGVAPTNK